ncbi:balbiani ring protein 3-like [Physella acuta]|uniref:balbiani ring protein 3-like n=1 Tax=Physella acuta TaxID=109671 RepID=UPI0027DBF98D|nr:balbiani ring protein 3-like [Physella acuta]
MGGGSCTFVLLLLALVPITDASAADDERRNSLCTRCTVNGQSFSGHSRFTYVDGCYRFQCTCYCNGTWTCPARFTKDICGSGRQTPPAPTRARPTPAAPTTARQPTCQTCTVDGSDYDGNSYFTHTAGCIRYSNCFCGCDGSWECPAQHAKNTCLGTESASSAASSSSRQESGSRQEGGSRQESGYREESGYRQESLSRQESGSQGSSNNGYSGDRRLDQTTPGRGTNGRRVCQPCQVDGQMIKGGNHFDRVQGCKKFKYCSCKCDGTWRCPPQLVENTCGSPDEAETCGECTVKGQTFEGNRRFELRDGCTELTDCFCSCNGSWSCAVSRDICLSTTPTPVTDASGCVSCVVTGQLFPPNDYFDVTDGCIAYRNCICRCDGSWTCPPNYARNICTANTTPSSRASAECRKCSAFGKEFDGNSRFEATNGCIEYKNCVCNCDGSWTCPPNYARNVCTANTTPSSRASAECRKCSAFGKEFDGNSRFEATNGCIEYKNCVCNCDGSWTCPPNYARNVCTANTTPSSRASAECRKCSAFGKEFDGNSRFEATNGCIEYKNCVCNCDGSWTCPPNYARNVCTANTTPLARASAECRKCSAFGKEFDGNSRFEATNGCIEYKNCVCNCDGSWDCPGASARDICKTNYPRRELTARCQKCVVRGTEYEGNTFFDMEDGCMAYRNCECSCNGSWSCPDNGAMNICERDSSNCQTCEVYGQTFPGNEYFQIRQDCTEYKNCICHCNGSWICPENSARYLCDENTAEESVPEQPQRCQSCIAYGSNFRGGNYFDVIDGCISRRNCICRCDGTWTCNERFDTNICPNETTTALPVTSTSQRRTPASRERQGCNECNAKNKIVRGNSYFELRDGCIEYKNCICRCDGSWECPAQHAKNICTENDRTSYGQCEMCVADGRNYRPNSPFTFTRDCVEYSCNCFCNGSWECPSDRSRWVCHDRCHQCNVEGRQIENGTVFQHKTGCLEYTCNCFCNGSWSCPGRSVRNTCPVGVNDNCNKCVISPTEMYEGESDFVLRKGECLRYKCRCNCDGSYFCPGEEMRNVCRGEELGGCRSCVVSDSEYYPGNTDFSFRKDCMHHECRCNCNGSWHCDLTKSRNVCLGETPGGCRVCKISENQVYQANQFFDIRQGCNNFRCKCNCNGSYFCPGEDVRDVCKGEIPGGCRSCIISANEYYPGNSYFNLTRDCVQYRCKCNCAGSYSCPGKTARRVCQQPAVCGNCLVSDTERFAGNSSFSLSRGCSRYECTCNCNGSWSCPASNTRNTCTAESTSQCSSCSVHSQVYPGNTTFKFSRGCQQYDCRCTCNGRWECDVKKPVNICNEKTLKSKVVPARTRQELSYQNPSQTTESGNVLTRSSVRSSSNIGYQSLAAEDTQERAVNTQAAGSYVTARCRACVVHGAQFPPAEAFSFEKGCIRLRNCRCFCNGTWQCREESNTCDVNPRLVNFQSNGTHRRLTFNSPAKLPVAVPQKKVVVDASAWVYVNGSDSSFVKTPDPQTGGGYSVQIDTKYHQNTPPPGVPQREDSHYSQSYSRESTGISHCQQCKVDAMTYPTGAHFDMRRGCVVYKCYCMCSGSYRCRLTSDKDCSPTGAPCSNCVHLGMVYPGGMGFTVEEGCYERQCKCECNGSYTCPINRLKPGCSTDPSQWNGFAGHGNFYPSQPGNYPGGTGYITGRRFVTSTCADCGVDEMIPVYQQPVFPVSDGADNNGPCRVCNVDGQNREGNSTFTFVKDCIEFDCYCACAGSWRCAGRISPGCKPGFEPGTVPHESACRSCDVYGTKYPPNEMFAYRPDRCSELQCMCNCDGSWKCPNQVPVNICTMQRSPGRVADPLIAGDDVYISDQSVANDQQSRQTNCKQCRIQDAKYPGNSKFFYREGCIQRICDCNCDGTWSCSEENKVDICKFEVKESKPVGECRDCRVGADVFNPQRSFQIRTSCYLQNCYCFCNGTHVCPMEKIFFLCDTPDGRESRGSGQSATSLTSSAMASSVVAVGQQTRSGGSSGRESGYVEVEGCSDCQMDGSSVRTLRSFIRQLNCHETLCFCQCNGTAVCPASSSVNTCDLPDKKPMNERPGCKVENKTYLTRVFPKVEDCLERTCICHDDGTWTCRRHENDRRVC